jgi:hypothetical protein
MLFSVGYTLPYDRFEVIFSLSQVQNFLGDEGDCRPPSKPQTDGNPLMYLLVGGHVEKVVTFLTTFLQQKQVLGPK